jgi:monofunctional biosynthetic peptidoglycan transglycosylase
MKKLLFAALGGAAVLAAAVALWVASALSHLPDVTLLKRYRPAAASEVLDRNGAPLAHYYDRKFRIWTPLSSLPDIVIRAVVIAEDDTFFGHNGVNYQAVWEAFRHDVKKGRFARGGSTITQQMIKNVLLSREKTLKRKVREFVLARKAEEILTKRRILEIYLNEVEWGENIYGIEAASRFYFDKHAAELTAPEAALLAGMLPNPKYYNPFKRPEKARKRQERVLFNMFQAKHLTEEAYREALAEPPALRAESSGRFDFSLLKDGNGRPCHHKVLEQVFLSLYDEGALYRQGLRIRTTLDKTLQDSVAAFVGEEGGNPHEVPSTITVLKDGNEIRALLCSDKEERIRFFLDSLGAPNPVYDVATLSAGGITKEEIVLPLGPAAAGTGKPTGTDRELISAPSDSLP